MHHHVQNNVRVGFSSHAIIVAGVGGHGSGGSREVHSGCHTQIGQVDGPFCFIIFIGSLRRVQKLMFSIVERLCS